jgi:hypothetical protein
MRLSLASPLQAFSIALRCIFGKAICETMDFYPFFRIRLEAPTVSKSRKPRINTKIISGPALSYKLLGRYFPASIREYSCSFVANILFLARFRDLLMAPGLRFAVKKIGDGVDCAIASLVDQCNRLKPVTLRF